jgi:Uncharacterized conserved protein (DUF2190)
MLRISLTELLLFAVLALLASSAAHAQCSSKNPNGSLPSDSSNQHQYCTAGAAISQGQIVSLNSSGNIVPIPHGSAFGAYGVAQQNAISGQANVPILIFGRTNISTDNACAVGNVVNISATNDGNGTCNSSTSGTQTIGMATQASSSASSIAVNVSPFSSSGQPPGGSGCSVGGSNGDIQANNGSGGCKAASELKHRRKAITGRYTHGQLGAGRWMHCP